MYLKHTKTQAVFELAKIYSSSDYKTIRGWYINTNLLVPRIALRVIDVRDKADSVLFANELKILLIPLIYKGRD
jgi:hypothetical protein